MTKEEICRDIAEWAKKPMTQSNVETLAALLTLREHAEEICAKSGEDWGERWMQMVGQHWTLDEIRAARLAYSIDANDRELWIAANAMWSDLGEVLRVRGLGDNVELLLAMANAFYLKDADAVDNQLEEYWRHIVRH